MALVHFRTLVTLRRVRVRVRVGLELRLGLVRVRITVRIRLGLDLGLGLGWVRVRVRVRVRVTKVQKWTTPHNFYWGRPPIPPPFEPPLMSEATYEHNFRLIICQTADWPPAKSISEVER